MFSNRVITMINAANLFHHPNNPRDVYDNLEELAESIRVNGIWQNLTVVPYSPVDHKALTPADPDNAYVVVMGNRRLEASYLAGLQELPCVISAMSLKDQIMAMSQENNLRESASPYKEAENYQMLLNMGETYESLAELSGLSTTTIRNRIKLLVLNKDKFEAAQNRGARLTDYLELDKIKDPSLKNKVLESIGTKNFARELDNAMEKEKRISKMKDMLAAVSSFAKEIDSADSIPGIRNEKNFYWFTANTVEVPSSDDLSNFHYYFVKRGEIDSLEIKLFTDKPAPAVVVDPEVARRREEAAKQEALIKELNTSTYKLRFQFMKDLPYSKAKKNMSRIAKFVADAMRGRDDATVYYEHTPWRINYEALAELLDIPYDKEAKAIQEDALKNALLTQPEHTLLCIAYTQFDKPDKSYIKKVWNPTKQADDVEFRANEELDKVYSMLELFGYETSDEEADLMNGCHKIFTPETVAESA